MRELIIFAGPQAAGKSTVIDHIKRRYYDFLPLFRGQKRPTLFPLQESRQIVAHMHANLGGIFMDENHERKVVACDLGRMDTILDRTSDHLVYLDECSVFTIAHARAHGIEEIGSYWLDYLARLRKLNAKVIFLNVPPGISWARRQPEYKKRLIYFPRSQHKSIMRRYHDYLFRLHPLLLDIYEKIPLPKEKIDGELPLSDVLSSTCEALTRLSEAFK